MIIWCRGREQVGSVVRRPVLNDKGLEAVDHPFAVLREATYDEYLQQALDAGIDTSGPNWGREDFARHGALFYEVATD
jgi:hypothetical protein